MTVRLPTAELRWSDTGVPQSVVFDDIYYAADDGEAESRHVFLDGIGAPDIWRDRDDFTLAETGFGSGLNFLCAWDLWRRTAAADARLHYLAVEAYPLTPADLTRALDRWRDLAPLAQQLIAQWPQRVAGSHLLTFDEGRVRLLLLFGDAAEMLSQTEARVDAWFLDGFAPQKNPDMWSDRLFAAIAHLSHAATRLASFTVAAVARRGLEAVGYKLEKRAGYGAKRECLAARVCGEKPAMKDPAPWFAPPVLLPVPAAKPKHVAVIGAGIAGLMTAWALQKRGARVTLYDRALSLVPEASGNPMAILEPWIDFGTSPISRLSLTMTLHALRWYHQFGAAAFIPCGVLCVSDDHTWQDRVVAEGYLPIEDTEMTAEGLLFPRAGMIDTKKLAAQLADGVDLRLGQAITRLDDIEADAVVLAASFGSAALGGFPLALMARRGQVSLVEGGYPVSHVLSGKGYVTPAFSTAEGARHLVGATFAAADPAQDKWRALDDADHQENLQVLHQLVPGACGPVVGGRTGLRAATADHMPIMGALPVVDYGDPYLQLAHGRRRGGYPAARYQAGRFVLTGLGARGYLTAPLLAETLAAMILGQPLPLTRPLLDALHPGRDSIRAIKRPKKTG